MQVGGDDSGALLVPTADEVVEEDGGAAVAWQVAQLVQDQLRTTIPTEATLEGWERLLFQEVREGAGEGGEAHGVALLQRGEAEVLGERRLAHSAWPRRRTFSPRSTKSRSSCSS